MRLRTVATCIVCSLAAAVCSATSSRWPDPADLGSRLLAARDAGAVDAELVQAAASARNPEVRLAAVRLVASVARPSDADRLWPFVGDSDAAVREAVQLAAGRIGPEAASLARQGLSDPDPGVRAAAVWAAAPLEDAHLMDTLRRLIEHEKEPVVLERLAAVVGHAPDPTVDVIVERFAGLDSVSVRRALAFWLARADVRRPALRSLAVDPDPTTRAAAVDGLARGDADTPDVPIVTAALADVNPAVRISACRVLAARSGWVLEDGAAEGLARCLGAEHVQLRAAAVRAAGRHPEADVGSALRRFVAGPERWLASLALEALALRDPAAAGDRVAAWLDSGRAWRRRAAARAAAQLESVPPAWVEAMLGDPDPGVRLAWLGTADETMITAEVLEDVIESDPDAAVRAVALERRAARDGIAVDTWLAWYAAFADDRLPDARAGALLGALEAAENDQQRRSILRRLQNERSAVVSTRAARWGWRHDLDVEPPRRPAQELDFYRQVGGWAESPRWLDMVTVRGTVRVRLDTDRAPLTARRIWDLAVSGFYDGLTFHRVVPNFVVQGGDPRGDGWGDGGVVLPDEPSLAPFDTGRVGIATSGPNTGGCQLFVMLQPAPHLDGHYTAFGAVTVGDEVPDRVGEGDVIRRVVTHSGAEPPPLTPTLVGTIEAEALWDLPGWMEERAGYRPDPGVIQKLRARDRPFFVTVVLGTWCSDSRREAPRLLAVLEALDESLYEVRMVGVDRTMLVPEKALESSPFPGRRVEAVPTVVVTDEWGTELGRVIEVADRPWEDLLDEFLGGR